MILKSAFSLENELRWIYKMWHMPYSRERRRAVDISPAFEHVDTYYIRFQKDGKNTRQLYAQTKKIEAPYSYMCDIFNRKEENKLVMLVEDNIDCADKVAKAIRTENSFLIRKNNEFMRFFNMIHSGVLKTSVVKVSCKQKVYFYLLILEVEGAILPNAQPDTTPLEKTITRPESLMHAFIRTTFFSGLKKPS